MFRNRRFYIIVGWLILWQLVSLFCNNSIMLVGPWETFVALSKSICGAQFWKSVLYSCGRIWFGMLVGMILGISFAAISYRFSVFKEIFHPFFTLIKAIPVASFSVLLLIWWGAEYLSCAICMLIVLPHIYVNVLQGFENTDPKLLEMAKVFEMPGRNRFFYIYRPSIEPFWSGGIAVAVGLAWKSGVAAEVIGLADNSIGGGLYLAKISLETADVFAWTLVTILLSVFTEWVVRRLSHAFFEWQPSCKPCPVRESLEELCVNAVDYSYQDKTVVEDWSQVYQMGQTYHLDTPSGSGKTTKLHLLAGLLTPDQGSIKGGSVSMVFQEDRLCEGYSAVKNVEMVTGDPWYARKELSRLLPAECLDQPCSQLSGGMRRRVALVRAMVADSQFCLLDEPFNGLDEANKCLAKAYVMSERNGRGIVIASHEKTNKGEIHSSFAKM